MCLPSIALLAALTALTSTPAPAVAPAPSPGKVGDLITLEVKDLTPKFLTFYRAAVAEKASPERRWELWKKLYDFAAVPPTPEGEKLSRQLLDAAWDKYPAALPVIEAGAGAMRPRPEMVLTRVAELLKLDRPLHVKVVVYVGGFEGNAFSYAANGVSNVWVPVEMAPERREIIFPHELTHAVHIVTAGLSGGWERSIAEVVMQEGLATRTSQALVPGRKPEEFIESSAGWLAQAAAREGEILRGIRPALADSRSDTVFKFTMGKGTTGMEREAYYVGWRVVGKLREDGMSLAQIAHIPASAITATVDRTVAQLLEKHGSLSKTGP